jgi:hypothetical protein
MLVFWVATPYGEMRNAHTVVVGKPEGKRTVRRPRRRWEDNIKIDLEEIEWEFVDWIYLARDRHLWWAVVNTVMNIRVHKRRGIS